MEYKALVDTYEVLGKTSKRLEKTAILKKLLEQTSNKDMHQVILLINGRVFPTSSEAKIGVASKLILKAIVLASGRKTKDIEILWKKTGDLGLAAGQAMQKKKQATLFSQKLTVKKVYENLQKLASIEGQGSVDRKIQCIAELLTSATATEAKYIVRTTLEVLRVGIGKGIIRDAIAWTCFPFFTQLFDKERQEGEKIEAIEEIHSLKENDIIVFPTDIRAREAYNKLTAAIDHAYYLTNDFALVIKIAREQGYKGLLTVDIEPFRPVQVMLYKKATDIKDAFKQVGKPAIFEYKYDGFRIECHKVKDNIKLYTRNFEDVTRQFPDVVDAVKKHVICESCIFDSEVVGFNPETTQYVAFQQISQRIKRKYNIKEMIKKLPVEINVFDLLFFDGKSVIDKPLHERRKLLTKMIQPKDRIIVLSRIMMTDNEEEANKFYNEALDKGNEGVMAKNPDAGYKPGSRVGFGVKVKPVMESLDLCVLGAEWGEGKRASWLTSFIVACRDEEDNLVTIGKVSTGLKELEAEGTTFNKMTELVKDSIIEEKGKEVSLKPEIVIEVQFEEIQKSTKYGSGFALRFPRFIRLREDRGPHNCSTLHQIQEFYDEQRGRG